MLDINIIEQVKGIFSNLENNYTFSITYFPNRAEATQLIEFVNDFASCSDKFSVKTTESTHNSLEFSIEQNDINTGIKFRGIPNGHEFTSLLLAILNADGKGKIFPINLSYAEFKHWQVRYTCRPMCLSPVPTAPTSFSRSTSWHCSILASTMK